MMNHSHLRDELEPWRKQHVDTFRYVVNRCTVEMERAVQSGDIERVRGALISAESLHQRLSRHAGPSGVGTYRNIISEVRSVLRLRSFLTLRSTGTEYEETYKSFLGESENTYGDLKGEWLITEDSVDERRSELVKQASVLESSGSSLTEGASSLRNNNNDNSKTPSVMFATDVVFPESCVRIESRAFADHHRPSLECVTLPDSLREIEAEAFAGCGLLRAVVPQGVSVIRSGTFAHCSSLLHVELPGANVIHDDAFAECTSLESVRLPDSIRRVRRRAFGKCTSLRRVSIPYSLFNSFVTAPDSRYVCDPGAFEECPNISTVEIRVRNATQRTRVFNTLRNVFDEHTRLTHIFGKGASFVACERLDEMKRELLDLKRTATRLSYRVNVFGGSDSCGDTVRLQIHDSGGAYREDTMQMVADNDAVSQIQCRLSESGNDDLFIKSVSMGGQMLSWGDSFEKNGVCADAVIRVETCDVSMSKDANMIENELLPLYREYSV